MAEQIRTTGHVTGDIQEETAATVEVESTDGIDLRALMEGGTERSDPNLADLLDTEVSVNSMAVIAVEGVDATIVAPEYLVT